MFDHTKKAIDEALCISDIRSEEIRSAMDEAHRQKSLKRVTQEIEYIFKKIAPMTTNETFFVGFIMGAVMQKFKDEHESPKIEEAKEEILKKLQALMKD